MRLAMTTPLVGGRRRARRFGDPAPVGRRCLPGPRLLTIRPPSRPHARRRMIEFEIRDHVAEITINNPPVNALPVAGWFPLADAIRAGGARPRGPGRDHRGEGPRATRPASTSRSWPPTRPTRSLVGVNRGCWEVVRGRLRLRGARDRRGARLLRRRRRGHRRQRRRRRRVRRRHVRAPRGRPRRPRRRRRTSPGSCRRRRRRAMFLTGQRWPRPSSSSSGARVERVVPRAELLDTARGGRRRHRGEEPDRDPAGQGVAERDRPGRREALATASSRASRSSSTSWGDSDELRRRSSSRTADQRP